MLNKKPGCNEGEPTVLSVESVVVSIEREVVEIEEAEPVALRDGRVATDGLVLVRHPHYYYYVERRRRIAEELRHDRLNTNKGQNDSQKRSCWKHHSNIQFQHLQNVNYKYEDLVMGVTQEHRN